MQLLHVCKGCEQSVTPCILKSSNLCELEMSLHPLIKISYSSAPAKNTFSLVYKTEVVLPVEIAVPSARMVLRSGVLHEARRQELEALDENHDKACSNLQVIRDELLGPTTTS